jgi:hypothetical protein
VTGSEVAATLGEADVLDRRDAIRAALVVLKVGPKRLLE